MLSTRFPNEDTTVGMWLAPLSIVRVHDLTFDTGSKSRGCFNSFLVTHKQTPADLRSKQASLDGPRRALCPSQWRAIGVRAYHYKSVKLLFDGRMLSGTPTFI